VICEECGENIGITVGTKVGKWTVKETNLRNKHKQKSSLCTCECGRTELLITDTNLKNKKTMQCKKCSDELLKTPIKVGDIYGEWKVIEINLKNDKGISCSKVRCSCGKTEKIAVNSIITSGKYRSCIKCYHKKTIRKIKMNDKFGRWTVIETGFKNELGQYCSKVSCSCGRTERILTNYLLMSGKSTQCLQCSNNVIDINVGEKFGQWIVIQVGLKDNNGGNASICKCDCGRTEKLIPNSHLIKGRTKQCFICGSGRIDLKKGDIFTNWTVIDPNIFNNGLWSSKCRCICGNEKFIKNTILVENKTTRCEKCIDMTTEEYKEALKELGSNVNLSKSEQYKGKYVKIKHICSMCKSEWLTEPINVLNGQKVCCKCKDQVRQSYMATALQQVLRYYYPGTEFEYDIRFKGHGGFPSRYDIYVKELNKIIECQSSYHDDKIEFDKEKRKYAVDLGYNYLEIDSRDYSPLNACKLFFPNITTEKMNEIVDWSMCSRRQWDIEKAQVLLNNGNTMQKAAELMDTTYMAIICAIRDKQLTKPKDYKIKTHKAKGIVQLDLDYNFIKEYRIANDIGYERNNIQKACKGKGKFKDSPHKTKQYLWYYKEDYKLFIENDFDDIKVEKIKNLELDNNRHNGVS
jgi:hypothetical protein